MARILELLPELEGSEQLYVARLMREMSDEQAEKFATIYRERRRDPTMSLVFTLIGLAGLAGLQRFFLGQVGMGIAFLLTLGFCYIGTIVDIFQHKSLTFDHNRRKADEIALMVARSFPKSKDDADSLPPGQEDA